MSKSKGNGIDPVDIIENYGTDAMRYVLCDMQTGTQDIRLPVQAVCPTPASWWTWPRPSTAASIFTYIDPKSGKEFDVLGTMQDIPAAKIISERFEIGRAFCTKLWNAARFAFVQPGRARLRGRARPTLAPEDRWILSRLSTIGAARSPTSSRPTTPRPLSAPPATSSGASSATGTSRSSSRG